MRVGVELGEVIRVDLWIENPLEIEEHFTALLVVLEPALFAEREPLALGVLVQKAVERNAHFAQEVVAEHVPVLDNNTQHGFRVAVQSHVSGAQPHYEPLVPDG